MLPRKRYPVPSTQYTVPSTQYPPANLCERGLFGSQVEKKQFIMVESHRNRDFRKLATLKLQRKTEQRVCAQSVWLFCFEILDPNPSKWCYPQCPGLLIFHRHTQSPISQGILDSVKLAVLAIMGTQTQGSGRSITR